MNPETIRYIRLKNSDEIIAYVHESKTKYICSRPVLLFVVNMFEDGKQLLNSREYLPPTIVQDQVVSFDKKDVVFCGTVLESFKSEYIEMSDYFFNLDLIQSKTSVKKPTGEDSKKDKVVSIVEALIDKKNKPVH